MFAYDVAQCVAAVLSATLVTGIGMPGNGLTKPYATVDIVDDNTSKTRSMI